jgi:hypothetical protein
MQRHGELSTILIIIIAIISFSECHWNERNETVLRQIRPLPSPFFDEIIIDGAFDIFLSQSNENSLPTVAIETTVYAQKEIIVEIIDNHILSIHTKGQLIVHKNIHAYIDFNPPLRRYTIKGTGNTITDDNGISNINNEKFILDNRGTANVAMQLNVYQFEIYLSGTGNSRFWGQVREQMILDTKGVGDINAINLLAKKVKVTSAGVSTIRIAASDDVQIEVTGVSTVYYRLLSGKKPSKEITTGLGQIIPVS